ncbi:MAG: fatty acid desaturase family protein [Alphaproteobacteria bacterium]
MDSTLRDEIAIARRHTPDVAWPTLGLIVGLWLAFLGGSALALTGEVPLAVATVVNTVVLYAIYTPLHDAIHSAVVTRSRRWRWVNTAVGMAAAAPIFMVFHHHRKSHFVHHARTNSDQDPDLYAKGSFLEVTFLKVPWTLLNYFNPVALYRDCARLRLSARERRITMTLFATYVALVAALVVAGYGREFVVLWLVPWFIGNVVMLVTFGWAPHHDHGETGRYRSTRVALFPGAEWFLLGQNLHLVHHMVPSVPFYRYRATFDELRPILERHGARIEGFWPYTPPPARVMA